MLPIHRKKLTVESNQSHSSIWCTVSAKKHLASADCVDGGWSSSWDVISSQSWANQHCRIPEVNWALKHSGLSLSCKTEQLAGCLMPWPLIHWPVVATWIINGELWFREHRKTFDNSECFWMLMTKNLLKVKPVMTPKWFCQCQPVQCHVTTALFLNTEHAHCVLHVPPPRTGTALAEMPPPLSFCYYVLWIAVVCWLVCFAKISVPV